MSTIFSTDAEREEPRIPMLGKGTSPLGSDGRCTGRCLRMNNNQLSEVKTLKTFVEKIFVNPMMIGWIDLSFNALTLIDNVSHLTNCDDWKVCFIVESVLHELLLIPRGVSCNAYCFNALRWRSTRIRMVRACLFVCCLTSQQNASVSQDLLRQFYVLPHCRSNFPSHPVTVCWHRANFLLDIGKYAVYATFYLSAKGKAQITSQAAHNSHCISFEMLL